jgi:hypothetical protein
VQALALFADQSQISHIGTFARWLNLEIATTSSSEEAAAAEVCALKLDPFESFYTTTLMIPLFLLVLASLVSTFIESNARNRLSVGDGGPAAAEIGEQSLLVKLKQFLAAKYDSSHLRFLRAHTALQADKFNSVHKDDSRRRYLEVWWTVSRLGLERKQANKHLERVRFEVASFIYMGVSKKVRGAPHFGHENSCRSAVTSKPAPSTIVVRPSRSRGSL